MSAGRAGSCRPLCVRTLLRPAQVNVVLPRVTHLALHAVRQTLHLNESDPDQACSPQEAQWAAAVALLVQLLPIMDHIRLGAACNPVCRARTGPHTRQRRP